MRDSQRSKPVSALSSTSPSVTEVRDHKVADEDLESRVHAIGKAERVDKPFQPCHMFFYGSLMDPEVIQAVLGLSETPTTCTATLSGFKIKMCGIYPALVADGPGQVAGCIWKINDEDHFDRLAAYETDAYTWVECEARLDNASVLEDCRTFCWARSPNSKELNDDAFDLVGYQKYFKASIMRRK